MLFQKSNVCECFAIVGIICVLSLAGCGHKGPLTRDKPEPEHRSLTENPVESKSATTSGQSSSLSTDSELKKRIASGLSSLR